ncbi:MAG: hypothetical protein ACI9R3_004212 [Verrucomicrobiales bacterium]|jgi:hypothetical protein
MLLDQWHFAWNKDEAPNTRSQIVHDKYKDVLEGFAPS